MKKQVIIILLMFAIFSIGCEKKVTGIEASIMEYDSTSEECYYIMTLRGSKQYLPLNLPEEFKTYETKDVIVSFKKTGDFCDCYPTFGDLNPNIPKEAYKVTLEKVKIKDIEFK